MHKELIPPKYTVVKAGYHSLILEQIELPETFQVNCLLCGVGLYLRKDPPGLKQLYCIADLIVLLN